MVYLTAMGCAPLSVPLQVGVVSGAAYAQPAIDVLPDQASVKFGCPLLPRRGGVGGGEWWVGSPRTLWGGVIPRPWVGGCCPTPVPQNKPFSDGTERISRPEIRCWKMRRCSNSRASTGQ